MAILLPYFGRAVGVSSVQILVIGDKRQVKKMLSVKYLSHILIGISIADSGRRQ